VKTKIIICAAGLLAILPGAICGVTPDARRDAAVEAIEKVMPAVVNIATETIVRRTRNPFEELLWEFYDPYYRRQPSRLYSLGSGVIIDEDGYLVTNDHVVRSATRIAVKLHDGREFDCDRVATSAKSDIAVLKIRCKPGEKFTAVKFAAPGDLYLGETVLALGNPFGLGGSVSRGILSSKNRRPPSANEPLDVADWLQTDAAINPGNSGGPLINLNGELIGINVAVYREGQGIGFAIPIKLVLETLSDIFTPESLKSLWFGARFKAGESPPSVAEVQPGSPAEKAGLKSGDIITRLNGKPMRSFLELVRELVSIGPQKDIRLDLLRGGAAQTCRLQLIPESEVFNEKLVQSRLGISVQPLTDETAERIGITSTDGLLITAVEKNSPAAGAGLERGFIITELDGEPATDLLKVAKHLYTKKKGETVRMQLLVTRRRGAFITVQPAVAEVDVR